MVGYANLSENSMQIMERDQASKSLGGWDIIWKKGSTE